MSEANTLTDSQSWFTIGREGWTLVLGSGFNRFGQFMSLPFLALYLSSTSELSNISIGLIIACGPLAGVMAGFYGGALSDHLPRKLVLILSASLVTIAYALFFYLHSPLYFALTNLVFGMATAVFEPVLMAACRDKGEKAKIQRAMMLRYTSINVSAAIAPLVGGYFATSDNPSMVFFIAGILSLCLLFVVMVVDVAPHTASLKKTPSIVDTLKVVLADKTFTFYVVAFTLVLFAYAFTSSALSLQLLEQFGTSESASGLLGMWTGYWDHTLSGAELFTLLLVVNAVSVLLFQAPMTYLLRHDTTLNKLLKSGLLMSAGYAVLILPTDSYHLFVFAIVIICAGESVMFPMTTILTDDTAPESKRGSYYGAAGFKKLGFVLAPPVGGWLLDQYSPSVLWASACFSSLLALAICVYASKLSNPQ
ncbi:MFS transporter [Vibrio coralliilyticus]|uniref:MFS transporter n=1 Tax=Vibrio coralliilyticus TaxID=190893 RepID=UPI00148DA87C|nr:MFS transporter [Vibrio coralliilyticus]NOI30508.1 MFS transporter [Vibrio coralliilyticus]NOI50096.1 MFS transporter [Vibrio coralliilyticus]